MNTSLRRILLATDGSREAALALRAAAELSEKSRAALHVVHVWTDVPPPVYPVPAFDEYSRVAEEEAETLLRREAWYARAAGGEVAGEHLREGAPAEEIAALARNLDVDLVILGSRGAGVVKRLFTGSVSEGVVHGASCPVLVVRGGEEAWPPTRIVVGDDGSLAAERAGRLAAEISDLFQAEVTLVRACETRAEPVGGWSARDRRELDAARLREERALSDRARRLETITRFRVEGTLSRSRAAPALLSATEKGEKERALVAVGSRGLSVPKRALLGSVSTRILRSAEASVLVVPPYAVPHEDRGRAPEGIGLGV